MRVYRIEDKDGHGAFSSLVAKAMSVVAERRGQDYFDYTGEPDPYRHPGVNGEPLLQDLGIYTGSPWHFGFCSLDALLRWFDSEAHRAAMGELGGAVVVYEVDEKHTVTTPFQTVFLKPHAVEVERLPIPTVSTKGWTLS